MRPAGAANARSDSEWLAETGLRLLGELGVDEIELEASHVFVDLLVELAEGGEAPVIDISDPAGGFGDADLWIATVIPALAAVRRLQRAGEIAPSAFEAAIDDVVARVRSPRAAARRADLIAAIRGAFEPGAASR